MDLVTLKSDYVEGKSWILK